MRLLLLLPLLIAIAGCGEEAPAPSDASSKRDAGFTPSDGAMKLDSGVIIDAATDAGEEEDGGEPIDAGDGGVELQRGAVIISELSVLGGEWIEISSASSAAIELSSATLVTGGGTFVIRAPSDPTGTAGTAVTVAPGAQLLGYPNPASAGAIPADADFLFGAPGGAANAFGDLRDVVSLRTGGALEDRVDYDGFPLAPDRATQLSTDALDAIGNDDASAWCVPVFGEPTPGRANTSCRAIVISEVTYRGGPEFIELAGPGGASLEGVRIAAGTTTIALGGRLSLDGFHLIDGVAIDDAPSRIAIVRAGAVLDAFAWGSAQGEGAAVPELSSAAHAVNWARADDEADTDDNLSDFHHDPSPTPGARNGDTRFGVARIDPDDAIAGIEATLRIEGTDFTDAMTVTVGGAAASCTSLSADALSCTVTSAVVDRVDVVVSARPELGGSATLVDAFTWTRRINETDLPAECDFCILQWPPATTNLAGTPSEPIFARIYEVGLTDLTQGEASGIIAELGYGPAGTDPSASNAWVWIPATFYMEYGNDDEYRQVLTIPNAGAYLYTYRFSLDGGLSWSFSDTDGAGYNPNLSFDAPLLGSLTVN